MSVLINDRHVQALRYDSNNDVILPLSVLRKELQVQVVPVRGKRNTIAVSRLTRTVHLEVGRKRVLIGSESPNGRPTLTLLADAPTLRGGEVWVPIRIAELLGATLSKSSRGELTITLLVDNEVNKWKRALRFPVTSQFNRGPLEISRLKFGSDGALQLNTKVVLNVSVNMPAYIQVYEVFNAESEPVLSQADDDVAMYPLRQGLRPMPVRVESRIRIQLRFNSAGAYQYVVVASPHSTDEDLISVVRSGRADVDWALRGIEVQLNGP